MTDLFLPKNLDHNDTKPVVLVGILECIIYLATCFCYSFVLSLSSGFKSRSTIDDTKAISLQYLEPNAVLLFSYIDVAFSTHILFLTIFFFLFCLTNVFIMYLFFPIIISNRFRKSYFIFAHIFSQR